MNQLFGPLIESLRLTWSQIQHFSPRFLGALLLLTLGWMLARLLRRLIVTGLRLLRIETLAERTGVDDFLLRGGVRFTAVTLIAQVVYWCFFLAVALAVFNLFGVPVSATVIERIAGYLPSVLLALIIVLAGSLLARFMRGIVETYLNNIGAKGSHLIGLLCQAAILVFVATMALEQLRIGGTMLISAFQLAFGGVCLALALAFGLGGKEWAAGVIDRTWKTR